MGEPAIPTEEERAFYRAYARSCVDAVRNEEDTPHPRFPDGDAMPEDTMLFHLAQEVELQAVEIQMLRERLSDRPR